MRYDYYSDYYEFENTNWWFVSRRKILSALLKKYCSGNCNPILDAGCGTGINLEWLQDYGEVTGVDSSDEAIRFCHLRGTEKVQRADLVELPFEDASFSLVTALDVLEHIDSDDLAVAELCRVCRPGGLILITVPVFPSLWSEHDEINHHVRRYRPERLLAMLQQNQLEIVHRSFMNTWLLPMAFAWRWWTNFHRRFLPKDHLARADNMHHHPLMNRILTWIFTSELPFVVTSGLPIGLSLVVLARNGEVI